jgi:Dolichyl-phosphate-mannose-protein mannosyltransferase
MAKYLPFVTPSTSPIHESQLTRVVIGTSAWWNSRLLYWFVPGALFFGSLAIVIFTAGDYGVVWDEPAYFHASDLHIEWLKKLVQEPNGSLSALMDDKGITEAWHWNPYNVPHPPLSRILSGLTHLFFHPFLDKFTSYRVAPALFFAALVTVAYLWLKELFGELAGIFSALTILLMPNLFAFAHMAVTDLPLASLWFLTTYAFWKGIKNWLWSILLGVVWGLALATKFPAVLIPIPVVLWAQIFQRNRYSNNIFAMLFVAPLIMLAMQPYLWHNTGVRVLEFLYEGISRGNRPDTNFGVAFFGSTLLSSQLPWYYSFFIVGVTTPEPFILLALIGILSIAWRSEQRAVLMLFLVSGMFVMSLGLLPGAVLHDGVRQLVSVLPFMAALAAAGFHSVFSLLVQLGSQHLQLARLNVGKVKIAVFLLPLFCLSPLLDLYLSHPFQLSYYNRLVGGPPGAYHVGLETSYFMEAFTPKFLRTLNQKLPPNAIINASWANFMFRFYQREMRLREDIQITDGQAFQFYILLNRRSALGPREKRLMDSPVVPFLSMDLAAVPLVSVFDFNKR